MRMLTLDVGTTCSKVQVFDRIGNILFYKAEECSLKVIKDQKYVDIVAITAIVKDLIAAAIKEVGTLDSIAVSSFGESFVLLDSEDNLLYYPMLYTDPRGEEQAKEMELRFGKEYMFATTGTVPHAMYSISKLLWIKQNEPVIYRKASKVMLICDYIGYILTGRRAIDYSLAARTGVFNIRKKQFADEDILYAYGIDYTLFSTPKPTGSLVGYVKADIANELGIRPRCKVILGSHDQVCATLGAGTISSGQAADGMGTVECMTAIFDNPISDIALAKMGYTVVPFFDKYCTYILNYTSNSVINWYRKKILHGYKGERENQFEYLEESATPSDILCLPYFAGCATPYQDSNAKGAFLNITTDTRDIDLYRAILESTSYEMLLNLEVVRNYGIDITDAVATGGGANSALWLQIKCDILDIPVKTLRSSEGGLCGLAMLSAVALGEYKDLEEAREVFVQYDETYFPKPTFQPVYEKKYNKYKNLYKSLKEFF